ncbi:MAG TPA: hypothetical protein ENJ84_03290, partial [Gammaproteobacteria bacterium]|nr:hypothetical protein [Gammaproteobacteria bacterium]
MSLIPPMPPGNELKALLQDVPQLNRKLEQDPTLLNSTRLKEMDLSGLVVKNTTLKNLKWHNIKLVNAVFEDVTIEDSQWVGVRCKDCTLRNVTFSKVTLDQDRQIKEGGSNFINGVMDDVRFIDSRLLDVMIDELEPSRLTFERVTLKNDDSGEAWQDMGFIHHSVIHVTIKDSTIYYPNMGRLRYPSEIIIENSHIEEGSLGDRLKRLEITHSHFEGAGPGYADYVYIADSKVDIGLPEARFIHFKNNEYLENSQASSGIGHVSTAVIDGCKNIFDVSFFESHIANLYIRDCTLKDPYFKNSKIGLIQLCNVTISRNPEDPINGDLNQMAWDKASIRQAQFHNVTFSGPFPVKGLSIGQLQASDSRLPDELTRAARQQGPLDGGCP